MKVRFTRQANTDLKEIRAYFEQDGWGAAIRVRNAIMSTIALIRLRPAIGIRNVQAPDIRSKLLVGYPYRIHYRVRGGVLEILHVRHTARQPWQGTEE